jgi:hypothetical protein
MDSGSDGKFNLILDGVNKPGLNYYLIQDLQTGLAYNFKLRALNFNGVGAFSDQVTYFSCLPPAIMLPPQYVSSTMTTLLVEWTSP